MSNAASSASPAANQSAARPATPATPQAAQVVTASVEEVKLEAGGKGEAAVRLDIADGYHVNANPPSDKFYIGTQLDAEPQDGITPGKPVYPPSLMKKFKFSGSARLYEGRAVIKLPSVLRARVEGAHTFNARIAYPATRVCLRPETRGGHPVSSTEMLGNNGVRMNRVLLVAACASWRRPPAGRGWRTRPSSSPPSAVAVFNFSAQSRQSSDEEETEEGRKKRPKKKRKKTGRWLEGLSAGRGIT